MSGTRGEGALTARMKPAGTQMEGELGFVGCGQLGQALLRGWLDSGRLDPNRVTVAARGTGAATAARFGVKVGTVEAVFERARVIILAVKPAQVDEALDAVRASSEQLVISVLAGVERSELDARLSPARVVRTMPNLGAQVGRAVTFVHTAGRAEDVDLAVSLFSQVGHVERLRHEAQFHVATALAGSGPAYLFVAMEAMADGAVMAGLSRDVALRVAAHVVLGAGALAVETEQHPATLKDAVGSPGGTTMAALRALEQRGFRAALMEGILAATARSMEMQKR